MIWERNCWHEYQPMKLEDAALFYDIPLIMRYKTRYIKEKKIMKLSLIGLHRTETVSIDVPVWNTSDTYTVYTARLNKTIQKACMKQWPVKDPFKYTLNYDFPDLEAPETLAYVIPDWSAVCEAAKIAIRITTGDRDSLFISLYNEALESGIYKFQKKYKQRSITATDKALDIKKVPEEVKKFILHFTMSDIMIERETGNDNKDTFDFIRIRMSIPTENTFPDRKAFISKNMKWFLAVALNQLNSMKRFARFGVPITCLSLKNAVLTRTNELELLFELKEELRHDL